MKISKYSVIIFGVLTVISFMLLINPEIILLPKNSTVEDIILSVFTSSLLLVASSLLSYYIESSRIKNQIMRNYIEVYSLYKDLKQNNYSDVSTMIDKFKMLWRISCEYDEEYTLFVTYSKKNKTMKNTHYVIWHILEMLIDMESDKNDIEIPEKIKLIEDKIKEVNSYFMIVF